MGQRIGLWLFVLAGAVIAVVGVMAWVAPAPSCRGVAMHPGDACSYSSYTETGTERVQTYEERVAASRAQAPVVVVLGAAATAFGLTLVRRPRTDERAGVSTARREGSAGPGA